LNFLFFLGASSAANLVDPTADDKLLLKVLKMQKLRQERIYVNLNTGNDGWDDTSHTYM
jgi:hypothetical protein